MAANLRLLAKSSKPAFRSMLSKRWIAVQDGEFSYGERWVVRELAALARKDIELTERLVEMPFFETFDIPDEIAMTKVIELFHSDRQALRHILALPEFAGGITDDLTALFPLFYLDLLDPESAEAIRSLPWVRDGRPPPEGENIDITEPQTIERLQRLAIRHPEVFWAVVGSEWMQNSPEGVTWARLISTTDIIQIADVDPESALLILDLPFMDTMEHDDGFVMGFLRDLVKADHPAARRLLSNPALQDPDLAGTTADFYPLFLKTQSPEIAAAVESLQWMKDGVDPVYGDSGPAYRSNSFHESQALANLTRLYLKSPEVFLSTVRRPWVRDAIGIQEKTAIGNILDLTSRDPESANRVAAMAFLDRFSEDDLSIIQSLRDLSRDNPAALRRILSDPALSDGISNNDLGTLLLLILRQEDRQSARLMEALPWVSDGVSASEESALLQLRYTALNTDQFFQRIVEKPWVRDGLTEDELAVVSGLNWLSEIAYRGRTGRAFSAEPTALKILEMPFLETVDGIDAAAVDSLRMSFWFENTNYLDQILAHPRVKDGITDDEAAVIASMKMVIRDSPWHLSDLLELPLDTVEKRVANLPHSGDVTISVVNLEPGNYQTMDILEKSIRRQEEFMGVPFPKTYAGLLVANAIGELGAGGPGGIFSVPINSVENSRTIAHELAHTYWSFFPGWIAEGGAEFMTRISTDIDFFFGTECTVVDNISELDQLYEKVAKGESPRGIIQKSQCEYTLGRGLFNELYDTLGDEQFREGFRRLYLSMRAESLDDRCSGLDKGICYVRDAFIESTSPAAAATAEPVITRWYSGNP